MESAEVVLERDDPASADGMAEVEPVDAGDQAGDAPIPTTGHGWLRRGGRPWWSTPAMAVIGVLTGVLYFHQLSENAYSNTFYAAAVKSGTESWKAFFFGSLDPSSFITVDKPPASLWVMEISGRIFGFSSISMLAPIAVAGALAVVVVFHLVRRWTGDLSAVLAATALAVTPVVTAIFRSNEPDAIMTLFLVLGAWALWSALETGATSRLVICSALLGLAFLTKDLEAFVVVPAFPLVYLLFGPPKLGRRLVQLLWGALALVIASGWWVAVVELWPVASRPYVDSSGDNSEVSLIFGYNGFGRLLGTSNPYRISLPHNALGNRFSTSIANATHFGSQPGWQRMFAPALGSQISWLIPVAGLGLIAGLWATRRAPRTALVRAGFVFWGTWALCAIIVLSFVQGIFHTYYVVETAPALAALAGGGAVQMWRLGRSSLRYAWVLPLGVLASAMWAAHLLERAPSYGPSLPRVVEVSGIVGAVVLLIALIGASRLPRLALVAIVTIGAVELGGGRLRRADGLLPLHRGEHHQPGEPDGRASGHHLDIAPSQSVRQPRAYQDLGSSRPDHRGRDGGERWGPAGGGRLASDDFVPQIPPRRCQLDRGRRRLDHGGSLDPDQRGAGHVHGRLHRFRASPNPVPVRGAGSRRQDPICAGWGRVRGIWWFRGVRPASADSAVGGSRAQPRSTSGPSSTGCKFRLTPMAASAPVDRCTTSAPRRRRGCRPERD